jgi:hypothetical protein
MTLGFVTLSFILLRRNVLQITRQFCEQQFDGCREGLISRNELKQTEAKERAEGFMRLQW